MLIKKMLVVVMLVVGFLCNSFTLVAGEEVKKKGKDGIYAAAAKGDLAMVKKYLKKDPKLLNAHGWHSKTPLHWAAQGGHPEVVKFLVQKGADVNSLEDDKETPMVYAAGFGGPGAIEVMELLLAKGAKIDATGKPGMTPLMYAVNNGKIESAKFLLKKGANTNFADKDNWSVLHMASFRGKKELIQLMVDNGADVNLLSKWGTPLSNAASTGNAEAVEALIANSANADLKGETRGTPLFEAAKWGHTDVAAMLLKAGANPEINQDKFKVTPLHMAALGGFGKISAMLLEKGADWKTTDAFGNTPLDYAARYGHKKVAKALMAKGAKVKDMEKFKKHFGYTPLKKEFKPGNAVVWYTGHSGWAVKTQNHLLVFDYWKRTALPDTPGMVNGTINPEEIKDMKVTVFVSHDHGDHYMPAIFDWKKDVKDITYVMGFKPKKSPGEFIYMGPREKKGINGMKVLTIKSNDSGVGFYVIADGVRIYHPGDHANRKKDFSGPFKKEIDYLAGMGLTADINFAPVSGCGFGDLEAVKKGVYYTVKKLGAKSVFPMHSLGDPSRYVKFAKEAKKAGFDTPFCCAAYSGDWFYVNQGEVKKMYSLFHKSQSKEKSKKLAKLDKKKTCNKK